MRIIALAAALLLPAWPLLAASPFAGVELKGGAFPVQSNVTVTASGSRPVCQVPWTQVRLVVNAKGTFTGSPTITYTVAEVDPGDRSSTFTGAVTKTGKTISAAGTDAINLSGLTSPCVKVSWTFTGTSITQVYSTLTFMDPPDNAAVSNTVNATCADPGTACAAGSFVAVPLAGQSGASVHVPTSSTLAGNFVSECSFDDGLTYTGQPGPSGNKTLFDLPGGDKKQVATLTGGVAFDSTIIGCGGATHARFRNQTATGSAVVLMRASTVSDPSALYGGSNGSATQPPVTAQVGGWSGTNLRPLTVKEASTAATATDPAAVVVLSPNGGLPGAVANDSAAAGNGVPVQPAISRAGPAATTAGRAEMEQIDSVSGGQYTTPSPTSNNVGLSQKSIAVNTTTNIKASAGNVYGWSAANAAATVCWLQFYNTAGSPTCGTSVIFAVPLPATPGVNTGLNDIPVGNFATGIGACVSTTATGATTCGSAASYTVFYK